MVPLPKLPVPVPAPAAPAMPARGGSAALSAIIVAGGRSSRLDGSPKALMRPPEGRELVHGAAAALLELGVPAPRIAVVGPQDLPLPDGVLRAREDPPFSGPASALAAGAAALGLSEASGASDPAEAPDPAETDDRAAAAPSHMTEAAWTLTLACDMPRIAEAARALITEVTEVEALETSSPAETAAPRGTGSAPLGTPCAQTPRGIVLSDRGILQPLAAVYRSAVLGRQLVDQPVVDRSVRRVLGPLWDRQTAVRGLTDDVDTWDDVKRFGLVPVQD